MSTAWKARGEIGSPLSMRIMVGIATGCGRGVARLFLWPTALYFFLRRGPERRSP